MNIATVFTEKRCDSCRKLAKWLVTINYRDHNACDSCLDELKSQQLARVVTVILWLFLGFAAVYYLYPR